MLPRGWRTEFVGGRGSRRAAGRAPRIGVAAPATARFYQLVVDQELTHGGDSRLARHVGNAILREDSRGARLANETKDSPSASTSPWPPSWPTTGPLPWPAWPETPSTSEYATTPRVEGPPGS
jgi:hypothetical protein